MDSIEQRIRKEFTETFENHVFEDEETIWLLSYADLMTLLFTFFVMLYSSVMIDDGNSLRRSLAGYLRLEGEAGGGGDGAGSGGTGSGTGSRPGSGKEHSGVAGAGAGSGNATGSGTGSGSDTDLGTGSGTGMGSGSDFLHKAIQKRIEQEQLLKQVKAVASPDGLELTFSSQLLFASGSATLKTESTSVLEKVISTIREHGKDFRIRVEGHTDDQPIHNSTFRSNWELSGARAAHIIDLFEKAGFSPQHLVAIGYGSSHPIQPNRFPSGEWNPEALRQNRRVVLSIYKPQTDRDAKTK